PLERKDLVGDTVARAAPHDDFGCVTLSQADLSQTGRGPHRHGVSRIRSPGHLVSLPPPMLEQKGNIRQGAGRDPILAWTSVLARRGGGYESVRVVRSACADLRRMPRGGETTWLVQSTRSF